MYNIKRIGNRLIAFILSILFLSCGLMESDDDCNGYLERVCYLNDGSPHHFAILNNKLIFSVNGSSLIEINESGAMKKVFNSHYIYDGLILNNVFYFVQGIYLCKYDGINPVENIFHEEREHGFG